MDASLLTREELSLYATLADLEGVRAETSVTSQIVDEVRHEISWMRDGYGVAFGSPNTCATGSIGGSFGYRFEEVERQLTQIREALADIQMTLRTLGLDDMSASLGDLNLLLT